MNDIKYTVARNIRAFREAKGMTQRELADKLGTVMGAVSNWEKGTNSPDLVKLFMMCEIFEVTPSVMFGMVEEDDYQKAYRVAPQEIRRAIDILLKRQE